MPVTLTVNFGSVNCAGRHSRMVEARPRPNRARHHPSGAAVAASRHVDKLVFRIPSPALIAAATATICATPFAFAAPGLQVVYLLPVAFAVWVVRNRTTVDAEKLVARSTFGRRVVRWDEVRALKVVPRGWLSVVLADESLVRLPAVRAGHLPALAAVSGGRFPDPGARTAEPQAADAADSQVTEAQPTSTEPSTASDQDATTDSVKSQE
jgi:Bacterial PH domain